MNRNCPACGEYISLFKKVNSVRKDSSGRKAGKLGFIQLCPYCNESLTLNKHGEELLHAFAVLLPPVFIGYPSYIHKYDLGVIFSISYLTLGLGIVFILNCSKAYLKNKNRWVKLSDFLEWEQNQKDI